MKNHLRKECERIIDNARHTATSHYNVASRYKKYMYIFEMIPAIISAVSGSLVLAGIIPNYYILLTVAMAAVTAVGAVLDPKKVYYANLHAAKQFTLIKNDANNLCNVFSESTDEELIQKISSLHEKYQQLVFLTPPTEEWAYEKARKKMNDNY